MRKFVILVGASFLALTGCGDPVDLNSNGSVPVTAPSGPVATAGTVILSAERAFGLAELGYNVAAQAISIPVKRGVFDVPTMLRIKKLNQEGTILLIKGKQTRDVAEKARVAAELFNIRDTLNLIKGDR